MEQIFIIYVTNHFTLFGTVNLAIQSDTFSNHDSTFRASGNGKNKRLKRLFSNIDVKNLYIVMNAQCALIGPRTDVQKDPIISLSQYEHYDESI